MGLAPLESLQSFANRSQELCSISVCLLFCFDGVLATGFVIMKNISRSTKSTYRGRFTLERVYRRIAGSSVVGTLTRVAKKNSFSGNTVHNKGIRSKKASSWSAATFHPPKHPQSAALQEQITQLNQQRQERSKSRRRARERKLQKVCLSFALTSSNLNGLKGLGAK